MIIAIDGPAGAGKSTVAKAVACALSLRFLDTGAMYRALTLVALRRGIDPTDPGACARLAREIALEFDREGRIRVDGEVGEPAIRSEEVTRNVSDLSLHPGVRAVVVERQRALAAEWGGLVAEGRDTTTVVFPDAGHKFFLIASAGERARRRALQLGVPGCVEEIRADIERRDEIDSTRAHSPLHQAADAVVIDGDRLDADGVVTAVIASIRGESCSEGSGE